MQKECKIHGITKFIFSDKQKSKYRCAKCNTEAVKRRRQKLKELSVNYLGGKCTLCGYNKCIQALEFHHKDPSEKDFGIAESGLTRSFDKIKIELDKCILVCSNCHKEIHCSLDK